VPKIEECHGGLSLEHLRQIAGMKSSTLYLSISTASFLHHRKFLHKRDVRVRGKACIIYDD